jgi:DNA-directed RNA polymerase subunit RPC12/RpoP
MSLPKDPDGNVLCSECNSRIQPISRLDAFNAVVSTVDVFGWVLAGLFAILGLVWWPAYLVAGLTVAFGLFKAYARRPRYVCSNCKRGFTYEEVGRTQ